MSSYDDIPEINALHQEQLRIEQALSLLDQGGIVTAFTIALPPDTPPGGLTGSTMPVGVNTIDPPASLQQAAFDALTARAAAIGEELAALGVTDIPAAGRHTAPDAAGRPQGAQNPVAPVQAAAGA